MQINASSQIHSRGSGTKQTVKHTFHKSERLCSTKLISGLFETGNIFHSSLFKVVWTYSPASLPFPAQVVFSVSKRSFRQAVSRNLAKRRMREAYRKNKHILYEHLASVDKQIIFTLILKGKTIPEYPATEKAILDVISRLINLTVPDPSKC